MDGGEHLLGGIPPAQGVRPQDKRLLVQLLCVHPSNHALLPHAVNHLRQTADAGVPRVGQVHHHVVKLPQVGNEPGGELKVFHRNGIPLLAVPLHEAHGQRMEDGALPDLDHQLLGGKELGRLLHQQIGGKGHKVQRALKGGIAGLGEKIVNRLRRRKILALLAVVAGILAGIADFVAQHRTLKVLNGLADDILGCSEFRHSAAPFFTCPGNQPPSPAGGP